MDSDAHSGTSAAELILTSCTDIHELIAYLVPFTRLSPVVHCWQPPDPATVRPQPVLEEAMRLVSNNWAKGGMDYVYACSQLKAIRQDLVVRTVLVCSHKLHVCVAPRSTS